MLERAAMARPGKARIAEAVKGIEAEISASANAGETVRLSFEVSVFRGTVREEVKISRTRTISTGHDTHEES